MVKPRPMFRAEANVISDLTPDPSGSVRSLAVMVNLTILMDQGSSLVKHDLCYTSLRVYAGGVATKLDPRSIASLLACVH